MPDTVMLPPAVAAFDAIAEQYDARYGDWASVQAQRRAVRRYLLSAFPPGARLLELGGGTGEDGLFMAGAGRRIVLTDGSPAMLERAAARARAAGVDDRIECEPLLLEGVEDFARDWIAAGRGGLDGAYSNFASLNCVPDLRPVARGLARLLAPGARALLVIFGPLPPVEILVQLLRGSPGTGFRRLSRGPVPARLGGRWFEVHYPRPGEVARAFGPWFRLRRVRGIGVFVPPSAAEPDISRFPRLVSALEALDRLAAAPLARLGDHVLLELVRTHEAAPEDVAGLGAGGESAGAAVPPGPKFRAAYAEHRAAEGRGGGPDEWRVLPYLKSGPAAAGWRVRARTFERFMSAVLEARAREVAPRPLAVLDLGAGNGWLCHRVARLGHRAVALDFRYDEVDGLGAAAAGAMEPGAGFVRVAASFDAMPLRPRTFDIAVFNAALHYAVDLERALAEAARVVVSGGRIAVLDSPFYAVAAHGEAMVAEKRRTARHVFGERADDLLAPRFIEFLTPERLSASGARLGLRWRRRRVRYPLSYEARPWLARMRRRRPPSRFDVWETIVP